MVRENFDRLPQDSTFFPKLDPNTKLYLSTKPYKVKKEREKGEQELSELLKSEQEEGQWIYELDTGTWYNIGFETFRTQIAPEDGMEINGVSSSGVDWSQFGNKISHYHFHTKYSEIKAKEFMMSNFEGREDYDQFSEQQRSEIVQSTSLLVEISTSLPNDTDLEAYLNILDHCPDDGSIDFKIVLPRGIITALFPPSGDTGDIILNKYKEVRGRVLSLDLLERKDYRGAMTDIVCDINDKMNGLLKISMDYNL